MTTGIVKSPSTMLSAFAPLGEKELYPPLDKIDQEKFVLFIVGTNVIFTVGVLLETAIPIEGALIE